MHMVVGTTVAAVAAYLFQLVGGRVLGPLEFAPVSILWTVLFLIYTILFLPVEQLTIRRLAVARGDAEVLRPALLPIGALGVASTAGVVAFAALTVDAFFAGRLLFITQAGLMVFGYFLFAVAKGFLAGRRRFREYGLATGAESVLRLAVAAAVLPFFTSGTGLAWAMVLAPFGVLWWRPFSPHGGDEVGEVPDEALGRSLAGHVSANAVSQTLLAGGPLLVGALHGTPEAVSIFFVTFTLFRGPITMTYSLVARVLPRFALLARGRADELRTWSVRLGLGGLALAGLGGVVGFGIGPALVALLFGPSFRPAPLLAALAATGVVAATFSSFLNQTLVARAATGRLAAAWLAALVVAGLAVALAAGPPEIRVAWGFAAGQLAALVTVMVAAAWGEKAPAPA